MILWRRSLKKCYYSENNGPLLADLGFLARAGATAICVVLPLVLALLSGRLVDDFDVRQIEMDARFNEGVLVVHSSVAPNLEVFRFSRTRKFQDFSSSSFIAANFSDRLEVTLSTSSSDVTGFDIFSYISAPTISSSSQLIYSQSTIATTADEAEIHYNIRLTQRNNVYWSNPAYQTDESDYSYLPSKFENVWDPDQAIKDATDQLVRMTASDRIKWSFNGSGDEGFTLKMTFWHGGRMMTMAEATTTAQLYRIIIQFIYFLIPIAWICIKVLDYCFESGIFGANAKIEKMK